MDEASPHSTPQPGSSRTPREKQGTTQRISASPPHPSVRTHRPSPSNSPSFSSDPVKQAVERKERRIAASKKAQERRQILELSECTFKPAISKKSLNIGSSARSSWPSLHEPKIIKVKAEEDTKDPGAEPVIDPYSKILCEQHDRSGPVHDRLMSYGERIRYKKNMLGEQKDLIDKSMSPRKFLSESRSEMYSSVRYGDSDSFCQLNDEYLQGGKILTPSAKPRNEEDGSPLRETKIPTICSRQLFQKDPKPNNSSPPGNLSFAYSFDFGKQGTGHGVATKGQSGNDLDTVSKQDVERVAKRCQDLESENLALRMRNSSLEMEKQKLQSDLDTVLEKSKAVVTLNTRLVRKIKKLTSKSRQSPSSEARSSAGNLSSDSDMDDSIDESLRHNCQNSAGTSETSFVTLVAGQRGVADKADEERATATADHGRNGLSSPKELSVDDELAGSEACLSAAAGPGTRDA